MAAIPWLYRSSLVICSTSNLSDAPLSWNVLNVEKFRSVLEVAMLFLLFFVVRLLFEGEFMLFRVTLRILSSVCEGGIFPLEKSRLQKLKVYDWSKLGFVNFEKWP